MLLFLAACASTQVIGVDPTDTGNDADSDGAPDTADSLPGPDPLGRPAIEPDGGTFVGELEVTVTVEDGGGALETCRLDPWETRCDWQPYTGPLTLQRSTIFRARVTQDGAEASAGRSFTEVEPDLAAFESPVPILVFWTDDSAPDDTSDVALGLTVHDVGDDGIAAVAEAPADSGRARLHVRGSSSSGFEKKAYDMELWESESDADRNDPLLGLPEDADWVLYAPYYYDEALIRNPLAFEISRAVGRYAPRHRFVELFLGDRGQAVSTDDYLGVYVLLEEIEVGADRVAITPLGPDDVAEPELTGGYLFKIDRPGSGESGFSAGSAGGEFEFQQGFVAVDPAEDELARPQAEYLADTIDALGWAVADLDGYDEYLDVDSFIDHHIVNVVMKNPDAFRLSGYFYKDREGVVFAGPAWDFDRTAGSQDPRSFDPTWWDNQNETTDCTAVFTFGWYEGLFADPAFAERYWARFESLLAGALSAEALDTMVLTLAEDLQEPAARDRARWSQADFDAEIAELRDWMATRHAWMQACITSTSDPRTCRGR